MATEAHDLIIVGAGAAGCVLAARLSEDPGRRVLLIEAGPDRPAGGDEPDVADPFPVSMANPALAWPGLEADLGIDRGGPGEGPRPFTQGFGVGGGSNINGMIAYRGVAEDYDRWRDLGCPGWGWDDVLPYFRKLETDLDFGGPAHGTNGPLPVRRVPPEQWAPFAKAMAEAATARGWPLVADCNADSADGIHAVPMSNLPDARVSAARAYLTRAVRARPNLTIRAACRVERIEVADGRAVAVHTASAAGRERIAAGEILLSAGALHSPAILLRSGIGAAAPLAALGIAPLHSLPGVGQKLRNKPKIEVAVYLERGAEQPAAQRGLGQNCLRYSSGLPGAAPHDMGLKFVNRTAWHRLGRRIGAIVICLYDPEATGEVALASADPEVPPRVRFDALRAPLDFDRLVGGFRLALELLDAVPARRCFGLAFLPGGSLPARLARRRPWAAWLARGVAALLAWRPLRRRLLAAYRIDPEALSRDPAALAALVQSRAATGWHVCGSCAMGPHPASGAVVDAGCRVHGLAGLRVIDASVFPRPVGEGGMQLPVLMLAEAMADRIRATAVADAVSEIQTSALLAEVTP